MKWMVLAGLLVAGPAWASGASNILPFTVDPYGGSPAEQDAFYGGKLGVLQGRAPWSRLFAAWRLMHGLRVGVEAGHSLALPCCDTLDSGAQKAWLAARETVQGVTRIDFIDTARPLPEYVSIQTCFPDAFKTAAATLADRIASHGAADAGVRAWLDGQDAVFRSCSEDTPMPPLPADASAWLTKDRDYQLAAQALYARDFSHAEARFATIATDADSPWRTLAPYLAARAAVRAALPGKDTDAIARARTRLAVLSAPDAFGHDAAAGLTGALDYRVTPDARRAALASTLSGPSLSPTAASDFKDSRRLGQSPAGTPAYLDWIAVFGRTPDKPEASWFEHYNADTIWTTDADALAHARMQWDATHDPAWLIAAMEWTAPGDGADLVTAAQALPVSAPAYLTALYHRVRLTMDAADAAATRSELDTVLARTDLSRSDRNLVLAERSMLAADGIDFRKVAVRQQPCANLQEDLAAPPTGCVGQRYGLEYYERADPSGRFGSDAVATIDRLPLAARMALAADVGLPRLLRLDLTVTNWTRAVLLGDPSADRLARDLAVLLPPMAPELTRFASTPPGADKRFAAWFILAKMPGASVDANTNPNPFLDSGTYVRPTDDVKTFDGHWPDWLFLPATTAAVSSATLPQALGDVACFGQCGGGAFPYRQPSFVDARTAALERGRYLPANDATGAAHVWEELFSYVQAHPSDPRAPEALYWLVRVSRFGHGHARSSFRAFRLLKARYPATPWAKDTRFFYD